MPLFYCCPCLNVRISCRSVSNNRRLSRRRWPSRAAFEQGGGGGHSVASMSAAGAGAPKRTPSAKLSVAGVSTEHAKLVRSTRRAPLPGGMFCTVYFATRALPPLAAVPLRSSIAPSRSQRWTSKRRRDPGYCAGVMRELSSAGRKRRAARAAAAAAEAQAIRLRSLKQRSPGLVGRRHGRQT